MCNHSQVAASNGRPPGFAWREKGGLLGTSMAGLARRGEARLYAQLRAKSLLVVPETRLADPRARRKDLVGQRVKRHDDVGTPAAKGLRARGAARWGGTFEPMNAIRLAAWA